MVRSEMMVFQNSGQTFRMMMYFPPRTSCARHALSIPDECGIALFLLDDGTMRTYRYPLCVEGSKIYHFLHN